MKIFKDKGYQVKRYLLMLAVSLTWLSCEDDRTIDYVDGGDVQQHADPYLQVVSGFIPFEVGTESYDFEFNVVNGIRAVESVRMLGSFFDAGTGLTSNEVVFGEYPVSDPTRTVIADNFTYDELKTGLSVAGNALPALDEDVFPGSGWSFRFEADYASGETQAFAGQINMVLSKYAGNYEVIASNYIRFGVQSGAADWTGTVVFISFIDQTTIGHTTYLGPFDVGSAGEDFKLEYDEDGNVETVLSDAIVGAFGGGGVALNCVENKSKFVGPGVSCDGSNKIVDDEGGLGKHRIYLTYATQHAGGVRQFYEVLEKIVD